MMHLGYQLMRNWNAKFVGMFTTRLLVILYGKLNLAQNLLIYQFIGVAQIAMGQEINLW